MCLARSTGPRRRRRYRYRHLTVAIALNRLSGEGRQGHNPRGQRWGQV